MLFVFILLTSYYVAVAQETKFYRNPGENIYVAVTQDLHLEWNYNPVVNAKTAVAVSRTQDLQMECGTEPKSGIICENTTGQIVLTKTNITSDLAGSYLLLFTNGEKLDFEFTIHVLDFDVDIYDHNNTLLSHFPVLNPTKPACELSTTAQLQLEPINVKIGDELAMHIKFRDNVGLISCYKELGGLRKNRHGLRKPGSVQAAEGRELIYKVPALIFERESGILVQCEAVQSPMVFIIRQIFVIGDNMNHQDQTSGLNCIRNNVKTIKRQNERPCTHNWGIPVIIGLIIVVLIIVLFNINKNAITMRCKRLNEKNIKSANRTNSQNDVDADIEEPHEFDKLRTVS